MDELRRTGLDKMNEVYAWDMPDMPGEFFGLTVEHLFGRIWTRPGLSMRDKRIMTLSVVTALGLQDPAEVQVNAALHNEELTDEELREMAIFLTHYVGFPLGAGLHGVIERVTAKRKKAAAGSAADEKKANVNAAVRKHTGSGLE
ncbi:carboxymuconolactone decarboxylase family protein [Mycobacterium sp.]|uniref:carboxymuconolactone decarboxylase family protein n=1 Tax=Mycobacterium sp. TaxID=1785 RepID=UPI0031DC4B4B